MDTAAGTTAVELDDDSNGAIDVDLGGTNATTASNARSNLGLAIGTNVQAQDPYLQDIADMSSVAQGTVLYFDGTDWAELAPGTNGYYLETNGAGANPSWSEVEAGGGGTETERFTSDISQSTFSAADATPDVSDGGSEIHHYWATGGVVTITDFDDGVGDDQSEFSNGDWFELECDHAVTINFDGSDIYGQYGIDYTATVGDIILFIYNGAKWLAALPAQKVMDSVAIEDNDTPATDGMILIYDNTTDDRYESKAMSGDGTISAAGVLTITGGDVDTAAAANLSQCIYIEDPVSDEDFLSVWRNMGSVTQTITAIWAETDQTVPFDFSINGSPVNGSEITATSSEVLDTSMGGDDTLAAGEELDLNIGTCSGTPTWVSICWTLEVQ